MYPLPGRGWEEPGPSGYTYAAVLVLSDDRARLSAALREVRFSGWLAPPSGGWLVAVAASGAGTVAAGRRGVLGVGKWLASRFAEPVLVVRVVDDRQLVLAAWSEGDEVGRYVSDPSWALGDDLVLPDPVGTGYAEQFAAVCGKPEAADDLAELLAEELDADRFIESERLAGVLRLLGLPTWLVTAASLPRDVVDGPLTRLGAGRPGLPGRLYGWAVGLVRRRRPPPPALVDPPRAGADPWLS